MKRDNHLLADQALEQAKQALHQGSKSQIHLWASLAARMSPGMEDPWLILTCIGEPRASVFYAQHALRLNPLSLRAAKALQWAQDRQNEISPPLPLPQTPLEDTRQTKIARVSHPPRLAAAIPWIIVVILLCGVLLTASLFPAGWVLANNMSVKVLWDGSPEPSKMPSPTPVSTLSATPSSTPTNLPPPTSTLTESPLPSASPTAPTLPTPIPTGTMLPAPPAPVEVPLDNGVLPDMGSNSERWSMLTSVNKKCMPMMGIRLSIPFLFQQAHGNTPRLPDNIGSM
jgi:hypothetical protein